jgi:hypothetical protein
MRTPACRTDLGAWSRLLWVLSAVRRQQGRVRDQSNWAEVGDQIRSRAQGTTKQRPSSGADAHIQAKADRPYFHGVGCPF